MTKFPQAIQLELSKKPNISDQAFIAFLECPPISSILRKEDEAQSSTISDIIDSKRSCHLNLSKAMF